MTISDLKLFNLCHPKSSLHSRWTQNGSLCSRQFHRFCFQLPHHNSLHSHSLSFRNCIHLPPYTSVSLFRRRLDPVFCPMSSMSSTQMDNDNTAGVGTTTVRVVIKGRVQGVFYRNWTIDNANELSLRGWVRNRRDGSVEALFSGSPEKVPEMEQRCRMGPPDAMVTGLQVFPSTDDPGTTFELKPTV